MTIIHFKLVYSQRLIFREITYSAISISFELQKCVDELKLNAPDRIFVEQIESAFKVTEKIGSLVFHHERLSPIRIFRANDYCSIIMFNQNVKILFL